MTKYNNRIDSAGLAVSAVVGIIIVATTIVDVGGQWLPEDSLGDLVDRIKNGTTQKKTKKGQSEDTGECMCALSCKVISCVFCCMVFLDVLML